MFAISEGNLIQNNELNLNLTKLTERDKETTTKQGSPYTFFEDW